MGQAPSSSSSADVDRRQTTRDSGSTTTTTTTAPATTTSSNQNSFALSEEDLKAAEQYNEAGWTQDDENTKQAIQKAYDDRDYTALKYWLDASLGSMHQQNRNLIRKYYDDAVRSGFQGPVDPTKVAPPPPPEEGYRVTKKRVDKAISENNVAQLKAWYDDPNADFQPASEKDRIYQFLNPNAPKKTGAGPRDKDYGEAETDQQKKDREARAAIDAAQKAGDRERIRIIMMDETLSKDVIAHGRYWMDNVDYRDVVDAGTKGDAPRLKEIVVRIGISDYNRNYGNDALNRLIQMGITTPDAPPAAPPATAPPPPSTAPPPPSTAPPPPSTEPPPPSAPAPPPPSAPAAPSPSAPSPAAPAPAIPMAPMTFEPVEGPPPITAPFTSLPVTEMYKAGMNAVTPMMGGVMGVVSNMRTPTTNAPSRFFPNQVQMDEVSKYADGMLRVVSGLGGRPAKRRK
jgi:hypothetical protein